MSAPVHRVSPWWSLLAALVVSLLMWWVLISLLLWDRTVGGLVLWLVVTDREA